MVNTVKTPSRAKKGWKALKSPFKKKSSTSLNSILNASDPGSVNETPPMPQIGLNYSTATYDYNLATIDPGRVTEIPSMHTMGFNYGTPPAYNYNLTINPESVTEMPRMATMGNNNSAPVYNHTTSDPGRVNDVPPMPKTGLNIGGSISNPTSNYTTNARVEQNDAGGKGGFKMDASGKLYWDEPDESSSDEDEIDGQFTPGKNVWYREPSTGLEQIVKVISYVETRIGVLYKVEHLLSGEFKKVSAKDLTRRRAGSCGSDD